MKRKWFFVAAVLLLTVGGGLYLVGTGSSEPLETRPEVGFLAPDFTLPMLDGTEVTLSELRGKRVFINFWATWCPPCRQEMPALQSVYNSKDEDVVFIAINLQEKESKVREFLTTNMYTLPVALNASGDAAVSYLVRGIPTSFVVDAKGVVRGKHVGVLTEASLRKMLDAAK